MKSKEIYILAGADTSGENWKIKPEIKISGDQKSRISSFIKSFNGNKIAALAPGSVWATKIYPYEGFIEIAKYFTKNLYKVVLIGGKQDLQLCKKIAAADPENVIITAGKFSLTESVELISRCRILISNDSAPSHLGLCTDTPVLTIYCSTVASFGFYPYLNRSSYISYDELDCKPCGIHGYNVCPIKTFDCGKLLRYDVIINEIDSMLKS